MLTLRTYSIVVTIYITRSKIKKKILRSNRVCLVRFSEQKAIISLCNIKIMVFITETGMFTVRYELTL